MTWVTGINIFKKKGYLFVEVMVTTAILAIGITLIFQSFLFSLDKSSYLTNRLGASLVLSNKLWQIQDGLSATQHLTTPVFSGKELINGKEYDWDIDTINLNNDPKLYKLNASLSWVDGEKRLSISRSAYAGQ